jgi:hypothetical protein
MKRPNPICFLIAALALCLVAFPPFIATLEIHHQLGEADQDGHHHSAHDLCSWVQSHASSSVVDCAPVLVSQAEISIPGFVYDDPAVLSLLLTDLPARGPPSQTL